MEGDAEEVKNGGSPVLAKRRFHVNDPLIVAPPKRSNKKTKLDLLKNESKKKALQEEKPVVKHAEKEDDKRKEGHIASARTYQMVILAKALQENTIIYLETGCGKTLISILLIKELASSLRAKKEKFLAVFMAPTVCLVTQQTDVLKINLDVRVDCFYGAKGVDYWSEAMWKEQVNANEVLVMTPMVFLEALRHGFLKLESFQLLIFDECHQAQKQHPYAKIMRDFYRELKSTKPRIFGMTASPVTSKGVVSTEDSAKQMQQLEHLLDAKVYTLEDKRELEQFVPTPVQTIRWFSPPKHSFQCISEQLHGIIGKYEVKYTNSMINKDGYKDVEALAKKLWKKIKKLHGCLLYSLDELGLWCAYESVHCLLKKIRTDLKYGELEDQEVQSSKEMFLKECSEALNVVLQENLRPINSIDDGLAAVEKGLITSKVFVLINCLMQYRDVENLRCIVFVERVVTAMVLAKILSQIGCLSFLMCSFLSGTTASLDVMGKKQQQSTLAQFQCGIINVLVATDVAEEGLDVQRCRSVIRFDLSKTVRSYIQSRGRARMPGSDYIIFLEKENQKQLDQLSDLMQSEESMRDQALNRTHYSVLVDKARAEDMEVFQVEKTGATVSTDSSISLITRFCSNLPGDKYYKPQPEFIFEKIVGDDANHVCKLILPPNGPFRELIGPSRRSRNLSKQSVCLEACKMLHAMGQLTDHLIPVIDVEKSAEEEVMNLSGKNVAGAGTNKRKELHGTASTNDLHGDWINSSEDVSLHAFLVCFEFCQEEEEPHADFVLLLKVALGDDIANTEFPIYLSNGRKATVKFFDAGSFTISVDQLKDAKAYHQLILNGMFGKLIKRLNKPEGPSVMRNVLTSASALNEMWNPAQMYLLLPLVPDKLGEETEELPIDWEAIRDVAVTANIFSLLCSTQGSNKSLFNSQCPDKSKTVHDKDVLQMARGSHPASKLKGMAVITIHTGRIYSVVDVLEDKNADCPIEGAQDSVYSSYSHYFAEKYKKVLEYPGQPLLQVKQSHRIHNLLTLDTKSSTVSTEKAKKSVYVELPPELCLCTGVSNAVIRTLYLFPSVFHRFNSLLLAGQLRRTIARSMPQCRSVKGTAVMQALTTLRCLEGFSFEGLELLGDSFLKYAVSRYLYLVYDKKHEGQLSNRRSRVICNEKLHHLAVARELPGYIRDEPFQPDYWTAPGMLNVKSVKCKCNLDNLADLGKSYDKDDKQASSVFRIGKTCSKGHRWICSKTVSDAVEALIGAFISCGDSGPALGFMKWIGMDIDFDLSLYKHARDRCNVHSRVLNAVNIAGLEAQLDYVFGNKALLVEALTHASQQDPYEVRGCYQRLEFLGDAVLDFLITRHLYSAHPGLSPGVLSDLRSAAVNNECFARSAVKHNLQRYLRHGSGELLSQITNFVKDVEKANEAGHDQLFGWEGVHGPKVLGDLVESIAGAILVDSGFDLDRVWSVMERILSPLVTPSTLPLHPVRELHELSQSKGFSFTWKKTQNSGKLSIVTGEVQVGNEVISETAVGQLKKTAKKDAAQQILYALKIRGIRHPRWQVVDQNACAREVPLVASPVRVFQASEKRTFDGDTGGSDEKRRRLSGGDEIFNDSGLHFRQLKLMDTLGLDESDAMNEEGKELSSDESSIKARMSKSPENIKGVIKEDTTDIPEDRKSSGGENKLEIADSLPEHIALATADEHATSINLKMSPSKSEDEATSVSYNDRSSMIQPLVQTLRNANSTKKLDTTALSKALKVTSVGTGDFEYSIKMLTEKGCGRAKLNEFCMTSKWPPPVYELVSQDGQAHVEKFTFSAAVNGPHGLIKFASDPMSRKNQAKDNAAVKVLIALHREFST